MFYPDLDHVKKLSQEFNVIPVSMEVCADMETPISLFKRFEDSSYCFLLESVEGGEKWARYSFIGRNPFLIVRSEGKKVYMEYNMGCTVQEGNPLDILKNLMEKHKGTKLPHMPRFNGGAVGFLGYDLIRYFENLPEKHEDEIGIPESHFMFTDEVIAFDHLKQKIHIIVNLHVDGSIERSYITTIERIKEIYGEILSSRWKVDSRTMPRSCAGKEELIFKSNIDREQFCKNVVKAKKYIKNGDIFQVVLSQRLCVETSCSALNAYRALRIINPSPYMYYLKFKDYSIAGASPEMLARVVDGTMETCPIAGTRRRGKTAKEDELLQKELLADEKELAEHTMLVDLGRNDAGKVCRYGTVKVNNFAHVEKFSHVMHIVSDIQGELREDKTPFDALISVLPAGTLSGAPKIRAIEIIDELEAEKRGLYGGAICYMSFDGNLDSCIAIRTVIFKDRKAYIQAGAGIVADSVPEKEYEESLNKAMAILKAFEEAGDIR